ncbi:hypothetical protein TRIATDRAFT_298530 [Trichoderma atroviride IMI 206040]|uniref:Uncharacterized protein n=1 Tax=Hypocrea atroviridis (strain ATCC 20476 / IMI 206040) TaxID=452589 RepID=G9NPA4_HYPAI|nr:uncharacterized protein TRIATDRAFT_298530 [Trichoderma atroviride IMI 206040]EHK47376.1 hypothetical protein TRIATDRAFT_298530 [Trichoderma atroviride IMI 206040]
MFRTYLPVPTVWRATVHVAVLRIYSHIISIIRYLPTFYESCRVHRLIIFESLCRRAYPNFASLFHILFICLFTRLVPS